MAKRQILLETFSWPDERSERSAQIFGPDNLAWIKTQLAMAKIDRENLTPDPESYAKYIQQESFLKGQIAAYQFLVDTHNSVIAQVNDEARLETSN
jgi:hypothetical protein